MSKILILSLISLFLSFPFTVEVNASGSLTTVKDTLTNNRPSFTTTVTSANAGDTTITVGSSAGFMQGDTITLCTASCTTTETKVIASIPSMTQLSLTLGLVSTYTTGTVYYKGASKHTITFTTRSTVSAGKFVVTFPQTGTANTTTPNTTGFVFNQINTSTDITLTGATKAAATTATSSSSNLKFTIPFTDATLASNTAITIVIGVNTNLLNPVKTANQGTADISSIQIDETDGSGNTVDSTTVDVGTIESVTVSATVAPSLVFSINLVSSGTSVAGNNTNISSTATTVPFGTLTVGSTSTIAQYLHIETNSNSGYAITVQQDGSLRKTNGTWIKDFSTTAAENTDTVGFGYSLMTKTNGPTLAFNYNDSTSKFFSAGFSSTTPVQIMSKGTPTTGDEAYVAYRVKVDASQAQGTYQNIVTYIATAIY